MLLPVETERKILEVFSRGNVWYTTTIVVIVLGGWLALHVNRKFAGQTIMAATVQAATVAWRDVSIA